MQRKEKSKTREGKERKNGKGKLKKGEREARIKKVIKRMEIEKKNRGRKERNSKENLRWFGRHKIIRFCSSFMFTLKFCKETGSSSARQ